MHDITGGARPRITQCLKSSKPVGGFDEDSANIQELADGGASDNQRGPRREGPDDEPPPDPGGGRLPTIQKETEADLDVDCAEERHEELKEARVLQPEEPFDRHFGIAV